MRQTDKPLREGSKLALPAILDAAFAVLDAEGFDGLSLRAVADRLEVQSPALYWHVRNRAELISKMALTYLHSAAGSKSSSQSWEEILLQFSRSLRTVMLQHQDSARLCLSAQPSIDPKVSAAELSGPLVARGLNSQQALACQAAVIAYTVGWVGYQQSKVMSHFLSQIIAFDQCFEIGLQAMVAGFASTKSLSIKSKRNVARHLKLAPRSACQ